MKLAASVRDKEKKRDAKRVRRAGGIPGILYSAGKPGALITVDGRGFAAILRTIKKEHLSTTKLQLEVDGQKREVMVKDIQYHPTTYDVIHLDFEELLPDVAVTV